MLLKGGGGNALAANLASPHLRKEVEQLVEVDSLGAVGDWRRISRVDLRVDSICQLCQLVQFFFSIPEKKSKFLIVLYIVFYSRAIQVRKSNK